VKGEPAEPAASSTFLRLKTALASRPGGIQAAAP